MGRFSAENTVCVLVSWALMLTCSTAQQDEFLMNSNLTWEQARITCQDCFKELVTVTSDNIFTIANKVTHTSWIGLQKINNTWSRWANGDPLTFQNWSPGTEAPVTLTTSCVAMLTLGVWVEKSCHESLPFICYEDRFFGRITVTKLSTSSVALSWLAWPGNITHYRLEILGSQNFTLYNTSKELNSLMPGTSYSVKVFANKCQHELNPALISFFTIPEKVENLNVSVVTENCLSVVWTKPSGNVEFYQVEVDGRTWKCCQEDFQVEGLTPGRSYTITVKSAVLDGKNLSAGSSITAFTKPVEVTELSVSENTNSFMLLSWKLPVGEATDYRVEAKKNQNVLFVMTVNQTEVRVSGLPQATQVNLSVTALAGHSAAETVTIVSFTVPGPVSNLTLLTDKDSISAKWSPLVAELSSITVELHLGGKKVDVRQEVLNSSVQFSGLKRGVNYTVSVFVVTGGVMGPSVEAYTYTTPLPPADIKVVSFDQHQITFTWELPPDSEDFRYSLRIASIFWGHSYSKTVRNKNIHTFSGLMSGTRYQLELRTEVGRVSSDLVSCSQETVADKIEVSLAMLCSSAEILLCDKRSTRDDVFNQLHAFVEKHFGNNIFWELEEQQSEIEKQRFKRSIWN